MVKLDIHLLLASHACHGLLQPKAPGLYDRSKQWWDTGFIRCRFAVLEKWQGFGEECCRPGKCWARHLPMVCKDHSKLTPALLSNSRETVQMATCSFNLSCPFLSCPPIPHVSITTDGDKGLPSVQHTAVVLEEQPLQPILPGNPCPGLSRHFSVCKDAFICMLLLLHLRSLSPQMPNSACTSAQAHCMSCRKLPVVKVRDSSSQRELCFLIALPAMCCSAATWPSLLDPISLFCRCRLNCKTLWAMADWQWQSSYLRTGVLTSTSPAREGATHQRTKSFVKLVLDALALLMIWLSSSVSLFAGFISQSWPSAASTIPLEYYSAWDAGRSSGAAPKTTLRCRYIALFELHSLNNA